jgi:hypothetical protein
VVDGRNDANKAKNFIQNIQLVHQAIHEQLEKIQAKYKAKNDKYWIDHHFQLGDQVWLYISREYLKDERKNLKPIKYGPFKILEKIGDNAFRL